jgi:hypothetical protein
VAHSLAHEHDFFLVLPAREGCGRFFLTLSAREERACFFLTSLARDDLNDLLH